MCAVRPALPDPGAPYAQLGEGEARAAHSGGSGPGLGGVPPCPPSPAKNCRGAGTCSPARVQGKDRSWGPGPGGTRASETKACPGRCCAYSPAEDLFWLLPEMLIGNPEIKHFIYKGLISGSRIFIQ